MTNSHSRRDGMRIYNQIRHNTFSCKGKILLSISHTTCSFLSMSWCKFISNLWNFNSSHFNFNEKIICFILWKHNLIYFTSFWMSQWLWGILHCLFSNHSFTFRKLFIFNLSNFSNNYIISTYLNSWTD